MSFKGLLRLAEDDPAFAARLERARERGMDILHERREQVDGDALKTLSWIIGRRLGIAAS